MTKYSSVYIHSYWGNHMYGHVDESDKESIKNRNDFYEKYNIDQYVEYGKLSQRVLKGFELNIPNLVMDHIEDYTLKRKDKTDPKQTLCLFSEYMYIMMMFIIKY